MDKIGNRFPGADPGVPGKLLRRHCRRFIAAVAAILLTNSCEVLSVDIYDSSQINEISAAASGSGKVVVRFFPMLEALYFCPGANVIVTDEALLIRLVRCRIKTKCPVTHPVALIPNDPAGYSLTLEPGGRSVKIELPSGERQLFP